MEVVGSLGFDDLAIVGEAAGEIEAKETPGEAQTLGRGKLAAAMSGAVERDAESDMIVVVKMGQPV